MRLGINGWRILGNRTGVGRYLLNIVRHWDAEAIAQRFDEIVFYAPRPIDRADIPLPPNMRVRVLQPNASLLVWENLRFGPTANDDVVFCPSFTRPIIARGRTVVTIFEATLKLYPHLFPRSSPLSMPSAYLRLIEWSAHNARLVLASSETARQDVARAYGIPIEKIRVVALAPPDDFEPRSDTARDTEIRRKYLRADRPYFLFVGKVTPRRNVPMLIEAFAQLKARHRVPHALFIVGLDTTGVGVMGLAAAAGVRDDVVHVPYAPDEDLMGIYNAATAFVMPHSYESVSLTVLEALATGTPVITSDAPGMIEATGGHALHLDQIDGERLVEAMAQLAGDDALRARLVEDGLRYVKRFSWRRTALETLDVLAEAARSKSPS
ncbi:MAG: glycosyltransferase family 4 protein [bacterium]